MEQDAATTVVDALVRWGQMPANPSTLAAVDWSGTLSVNRGALSIRRVVAFEAATGDRVAPRTSRTAIDFVSTTKPASDGLRLTIIDPTPNAPEPLVLTYSNSEGTVFSAELSTLSAVPQSFDTDEAGNRVAIIGVSRSREANCESGTMRGRWHKVGDDRGRLFGQVRSSEGELLGHMKGIYGQRPNGKRMVFGKYINTDGVFKGLFAGRYRAGNFRGVWMTNAGQVGGFGGQYRELVVDPTASDAPEIGGHYLGRWASKACRVSIQPAGEVPDIEIPDAPQ